MVTEFIKRGQKMGFDENGDLVYKLPLDEATPVIVEIEEEDEEEEEVSPSFGNLFKK